MEKLRIITYVTPVTRVFEVKTEVVFCNHTGEVPDIEHGWDMDF